MPADSVTPSLWRRIHHTPMRDLLRLRLTGRLDVRSRLETASISEETKNLIHRVTKRTKLWRLEKSHVIDELIAHFSDAVDAGVTSEDAIKRFGDPEIAAKLIRRAKIRNRPIVWHAWKWLLRGFALLIVFYIGLAIYFQSGEPNIATDYLAKLNAPALAIADDQRGWVKYREALLLIGWDDEKNQEEYRKLNSDWDPDEVDVDALARWLEPRSAAIQLIRDGASRAELGVVLGIKLNPLDQQLLYGNRKLPQDDAEGVWGSTALISLRIHQFRIIGVCVDLLRDDARVARECGETDRWFSDVRACIEFSDQQMKQLKGFSTMGHIATASRWVGQCEIGQMLSTNPGKLTSQQLRELAHMISGPEVPGDLFSMESERIIFLDLIQRTYTDDGKGDGRLSKNAWQMGAFYLDPTSFGVPTTGRNLATNVIGPASLLVTASRREITDKLNKHYDQQQLLLNKPLRESVADLDSSYDDESFKEIRYWPIGGWVQGARMIAQHAEQILSDRDGLQVAIALELYHRANSKYPGSLEELLTGYLPKIPADRISGWPIKYRLIDGKPYVYSVGADRDDDGGRPARNRAGAIRNQNSARWTVDEHTPLADGDWVLYPPIADEK